jgi:hypothetical protein
MSTETVPAENAPAIAPFQVATHNGIITIKSRTTGEHRTLRIHTQPKDAKFAAGERVVEILSGPDDYRGFAFVKSDGSVILWKKYRDSDFYVWIARFLRHPERFLNRVEINFEGKCRRCNRDLTTPESVASGIGPTCAGMDE